MSEFNKVIGYDTIKQELKQICDSLYDIGQWINNWSKGLLLVSCSSREMCARLLDFIGSSKKRTVFLSREAFIRLLMEKITKKQSKDFDFLFQYDFVCISDLDAITGRTETEKEMAKTLTELSKERVVIVTGTNLRNKLPTMVSNLELYDTLQWDRKTEKWSVEPCPLTNRQNALKKLLF